MCMPVYVSNSKFLRKNDKIRMKCIGKYNVSAEDELKIFGYAY